MGRCIQFLSFRDLIFPCSAKTYNAYMTLFLCPNSRMNESVFTGQTKCKAETKKSHVMKYIVGDKILLGFVI